MKNNKLQIALIGQGARGYSTLRDFFVKQNDIDILYTCDVYEDRAERSAYLVAEKMGNSSCQAITDYHKALADNNVDAVLIYTSWDCHVRIAIDAMNAGKITAMEVGGASSIEECWDLVKTYEKTKTPFMFLENCCYDKRELLALKMARAGIFGDIVHCSGAYAHDLRYEISHGKENRHYRLKNYLHRNAENYPTHDLGPIAKLLDINRGNRMVSLVSVASKSAGLSQYICDREDTINPELIGKTFRQGDIVDTIITCAGGETIRLKLDTTLPGFYNRDFTVRGTKGMYMQLLNCALIDGIDNKKEFFDPIDSVNALMNNAERYENLLPDQWKNITEEERAAGHGGMDGIMLRQFINRAKSGEPFAIDVYDAAAWIAVTALSEASIALGGAPVAFPDFTNGTWINRERVDVL